MWDVVAVDARNKYKRKVYICGVTVSVCVLCVCVCCVCVLCVCERERYQATLMSSPCFLENDF